MMSEYGEKKRRAKKETVLGLVPERVGVEREGEGHGPRDSFHVQSKEKTADIWFESDRKRFYVPNPIRMSLESRKDSGPGPVQVDRFR